MFDRLVPDKTHLVAQKSSSGYFCADRRTNQLLIPLVHARGINDTLYACTGVHAYACRGGSRVIEGGANSVVGIAMGGAISPRRVLGHAPQKKKNWGQATSISAAISSHF